MYTAVYLLNMVALATILKQEYVMSPALTLSQSQNVQYFSSSSYSQSKFLEYFTTLYILGQS